MNDHVTGVSINHNTGIVDAGNEYFFTIEDIVYFLGTGFVDVIYTKDTYEHWKAFNGVGGNDQVYLSDGLDWIGLNHWSSRSLEGHETNRLTIIIIIVWNNNMQLFKQL